VPSVSVSGNKGRGGREDDRPLPPDIARTKGKREGGGVQKSHRMQKEERKGEGGREPYASHSGHHPSPLRGRKEVRKNCGTPPEGEGRKKKKDVIALLSISPYNSARRRKDTEEMSRGKTPPLFHFSQGKQGGVDRRVRPREGGEKKKKSPSLLQIVPFKKGMGKN